MLIIQSQQTVRNLLSSGEEGIDFVSSVLGFLLLWDLVKEALNHLRFFSYLFRLFYWIVENYLWKMIVYGKYTAENLVCTSAPRCVQEWSEDGRALAPPAPALGFSSLGSPLELGALGSPPTLPGPLPGTVRTAGLELAHGASPGIGSVSCFCSS